MTLKQKWAEYNKDPFGFIDNLDLSFKGIDFNIYAKFRNLRKSIFGLALVSAFLWAFLGFDSCAIQIEKFLWNFPAFLMGKISWQELVAIYNSYYGREMHWSAFVIYGLMFVGLSYYYEKKLGIIKSKNVAYAFSLTLFSIPFFEFFWMLMYGTFQGQWWVLTFQWPQIRIIMQNIVFLLVGGLAILYIYSDKLRLRFNWKTGALISLSVMAALFWIYYPFYVNQITVETTTGAWTSSRNFPQTLYTVEMDPTDNVNAGEWFYVENNGVHAINTVVKVLFTLTFFQIARVKRRKEIGMQSP